MFIVFVLPLHYGRYQSMSQLISGIYTRECKAVELQWRLALDQYDYSHSWQWSPEAGITRSISGHHPIRCEALCSGVARPMLIIPGRSGAIYSLTRIAGQTYRRTNRYVWWRDRFSRRWERHLRNTYNSHGSPLHVHRAPTRIKDADSMYTCTRVFPVHYVTGAECSPICQYIYTFLRRYFFDCFVHMTFVWLYLAGPNNNTHRLWTKTIIRILS